jgi:hypothetical protein
MTANGHLPEGAVLLTAELLERATRTMIRCPFLSGRAGQDVYVRIRTIRRASYLLMLPPLPLEASATWPQDDPEGWQREYQHWLETLPAEERQAKNAAAAEVTWKVVRAGLVEPQLSEASLVDLADDADQIAREILRFSGLLLTPTEAPAPVESPAPATG